ncbi:hypothetical protein FK513_29920, partial [Klebsiella pneumoniae]|nr:hypothetical protein [Klebsiella pneumoniae]
MRGVSPVISQFWIREKRNKTLKDHFQYLFLPMCGALTVGALGKPDATQAQIERVAQLASVHDDILRLP